MWEAAFPPGPATVLASAPSWADGAALGPQKAAGRSAMPSHSRERRGRWHAQCGRGQLQETNSLRGLAPLMASWLLMFPTGCFSVMALPAWPNLWPPPQLWPVAPVDSHFICLLEKTRDRPPHPKIQQSKRGLGLLFWCQIGV